VNGGGFRPDFQGFCLKAVTKVLARELQVSLSRQLQIAYVFRYAKSDSVSDPYELLP